jgi:octaprenyl-diphosphate synthase
MRSLVDLPAPLVPLADFVAGSLSKVQAIFDNQLTSDLPPVARLCRHVERYRGKMLRPTMVVLCGLAAHPRAASDPPESIITREHLTIAAVCEMVHMATLVHDDVLDEADTRRRGDTVNRLYGNEAAVILGDYLIASAYHLCSGLPTSRAARAVGHASMVMCSGELLQLHHRGDYSLDQPTYFEIIERKTAELIATSAELGAAQSGADEQTCARLADFGRKLGIAFQIQDDLLDLTGKESIVGKSVGKDLDKGKMTLPIIHHLATADPRRRGRTLRLLDEASTSDRAAAGSAEILAALDGTGSVAFAFEVAADYVGRAIYALHSLQESAAKETLLSLAHALITRSF